MRWTSVLTRFLFCASLGSSPFKQTRCVHCKAAVPAVKLCWVLLLSSGSAKQQLHNSVHSEKITKGIWGGSQSALQKLLLWSDSPVTQPSAHGKNTVISADAVLFWRFHCINTRAVVKL